MLLMDAFLFVIILIVKLKVKGIYEPGKSNANNAYAWPGNLFKTFCLRPFLTINFKSIKTINSIFLSLKENSPLTSLGL